MSKYIVIVSFGGDIFRHLNGERHCENHPAVENFSGFKGWYVNGVLHREDGPAIEYLPEHKEWFLHGRRLDEEEFAELRKVRDNG